MSFEKQRQLIDLFDALNNLTKEERAPILLQANMLEGDFKDFTNEVLEYCDTDHEQEWVSEHFEENLEQYIEDHFGNCEFKFQRDILTKVLKNFTELELSELANIKYLKTEEVQNGL